MIVSKYVLKDIKKQVVVMPVLARILCVQLQYERPVIWAEVSNDPNISKEERTVRIYQIGEPFDDVVRHVYIGTYQDGPYVFHVYEQNNDIP